MSAAAASWDGPRLVLSLKYSAGEKELGDSKDGFTLMGDTLTIEHTRNSPRGTMTGTQVFVRSK